MSHGFGFLLWCAGYMTGFTASLKQPRHPPKQRAHFYCSSFLSAQFLPVPSEWVYLDHFSTSWYSVAPVWMPTASFPARAQAWILRCWNKVQVAGTPNLAKSDGIFHIMWETGFLMSITQLKGTSHYFILFSYHSEYNLSLTQWCNRNSRFPNSNASSKTQIISFWLEERSCQSTSRNTAS